MITLEQLQLMLPQNNSLEEWIDPVNSVLTDYEINTDERIAAFISQTAHESLDWTVLEENLNYSSNGLLRIFPKYFNQALATQYNRKPEMIANRVYANRMGNGTEESGEGYLYRGRGILQITGKNNYTEFSQFCFGNTFAVDNPDVVLEKEYALRSACWYWTKNKLNNYADNIDIQGLTKRINGGLIGLDDRISKYNGIIETLTA